MIFIILTFITALLIEGLGTTVSVIGLSSIFTANPIIIALAISLDLGKLVVVSLVYTHWKKLGKLMRTYALIAAAITMTITSTGAAGYLSSAFQHAILAPQELSVKVDILKKEQIKLDERKKQIDDQIAKLPEKFSAGQRIRMINQFKEEQKQVTARLVELDKELPTLQVQQVRVESEAGPILYIAKAFEIPVEVAVKYVILMIIFVFDPLAVFLIVAGNFLVTQRAPKKEAEIKNTAMVEEHLSSTSEDISAIPSKSNDVPVLDESKATTREQITLEQLKPSPSKSSMSDIKADDSVIFEAQAKPSAAGLRYKNLR